VKRARVIVLIMKAVEERWLRKTGREFVVIMVVVTVKVCQYSRRMS